MFTILLALFACASDTSSPEGFRAAYADAYCGYAVACSSPGMDYDFCAAEIVTVTADLCPDGYIIDRAIAADCLDTVALHEQECGADWGNACVDVCVPA